ncbi:MAG: hypothetical protein CME62_13615 [Halobacteriovoraceae bacterium]|nr:hypothetical protein [Halobacteriovoraceae bacterium]
MLFTLCLFINTAYSEAVDAHIDISYTEASLNKITDIQLISPLIHCDDCDDDCSEEKDCCQKLCSSVHATLYHSPQTAHMCKNNVYSLSNHWYYFNNYISPHIEPAVNPPFFA